MQVSKGNKKAAFPFYFSKTDEKNKKNMKKDGYLKNNLTY